MTPPGRPGARGPTRKTARKARPPGSPSRPAVGSERPHRRSPPVRAAMDSPQALPIGAFGLRAFAKVNLHLEVLRRRPDGYHDIETILQSVGLFDTLHLVPRPMGFRVLCDTPSVPVDASNLCLRAGKALLEAAGLVEPPAGVRIDLYKRIPVAAGFGGGSADTAAALLGLNRFWQLGLPAAALAELAGGLGSDVAFCLRGGTALGRGRGERLTPLPALPPTCFLLVFPGIPIRAEWSYSHLSMGLTRRPHAFSINQLKSILARYPEAARGFYNRLEDAVCPANPLIAEICSRLLQNGARVAMMSGSGGGVFAAFRDRAAAQRARRNLARTDWPMPIVESVNCGVEFFTR